MHTHEAAKTEQTRKTVVVSQQDVVVQNQPAKSATIDVNRTNANDSSHARPSGISCSTATLTNCTTPSAQSPTPHRERKKERKREHQRRRVHTHAAVKTEQTRKMVVVSQQDVVAQINLPRLRQSM